MNKIDQLNELFRKKGVLSVRDGCDVLEPSRRLDVSDSADVVVADVAVQKDPCIIGGVSPQPIGKVLIM